MSGKSPAVWLAAYPRSGVTFLRLLIERVYGLPTYTLYRDEWKATDGLFPSGRMYPYDCGHLPFAFVKTHDLVQAWSDKPAIHLVRDPRDTLVSYAHYNKDICGHYGEHWELLVQCIHGMCDKGTWGQHSVTWFGRPAVRLHFDELTTTPLEAVTRAVGELGLGLEPKAEKMQAFEELQARYPKFFRSGQTGQWKTEFPPHLLAEFETTNGAAIQTYEMLFGRKIRGERA